MEAKKETAQERRKRLDHERYMRNRDKRLIKQREYYKEHREQVILKVKECKKNRWRREYDRLFTNTVTL